MPTIKRSPSPKPAWSLLGLLGFLVLAAFNGCASQSAVFIQPEPRVCTKGASHQGPIRVASFNIRAGLSSSLEQVGDVLEALDADVIALQEVDVGVARTGGVDQPAVLAQRLGASYAFAAAIEREGGDYGVAMLSRHPFIATERIDLRAPASLEPRVAIDASVCVGGSAVRVVGVHSDVFGWSSSANARDLVEAVRGTVGQGLVVAGDLNAAPGDAAPRALAALGLDDSLARFAEGPTYLGIPRRRLDYIFSDATLPATEAHRVELEGEISDHMPVLAVLSRAD